MPYPARAIAALSLSPLEHQLLEASARVLAAWGWTDSLSSPVVRTDDERSLVIAGVWRLTVGSQGVHVDRRQGPQTDWQPIRLGSIGLSGGQESEDEEGDEDKAMPFLRMWPRRSPGEWLDALWPQALGEALIYASEQLRCQGTVVEEALLLSVRQHLQTVWFGPGGVVKSTRLAEQARDLRYRVEALFSEPKFVSHVRAIRRGFPVGLGHLVQAWSRRHALRAVAKANRAWLPLLNVIALRHWDSPGWQLPEGWLRRQALVWDRYGEARLPWGEGLRWHETELPVFGSQKRAQAWLARSATEACVGVWGCAETVQAFEKDWTRWCKRPGWPRKALPSAVMGELQRIHKKMDDHLVHPLCEGLVDEATHHWLGLSLEAWQTAGFEGWALAKDGLATDWERLMERLRQIRNDYPDGLAALDSPHPWVVAINQARQQQRERALEDGLPSPVPSETRRERF